jgi:hypothetical protein
MDLPNRKSDRFIPPQIPILGPETDQHETVSNQGDPRVELVGESNGKIKINHAKNAALWKVMFLYISLYIHIWCVYRKKVSPTLTMENMAKYG